MKAADPIGDRETLTVRIPLRLRKRGGRKLMVLPEGAGPCALQRARVDNAMVKAIARAHRWRRLLENGEYGSITDLATAEKINQSYVCRILRLTLLAPEIVEPIMVGIAEFSLADFMRPLPATWAEQMPTRLRSSDQADHAARSVGQ